MTERERELTAADLIDALAAYKGGTYCVRLMNPGKGSATIHPVMGVMDFRTFSRRQLPRRGRGAIRSTSTYRRCCASTVTAASRCASTGTWSGV